jgi:hypothetical protein
MMMRLEDGSAVKVTTIFRVETTYEPWPTQKVSRRYSRIPAQACASIQGVGGSLTGPCAEPRSAKKKRWRRSPNRARCRSRNKQLKTRMAGPYTGLGVSCLEAGGVCDEKGRRSDDRPRKSDVG